MVRFSPADGQSIEFNACTIPHVIRDMLLFRMLVTPVQVVPPTDVRDTSGCTSGLPFEFACEHYSQHYCNCIYAMCHSWWVDKPSPVREGPYRPMDYRFHQCNKNCIRKHVKTTDIPNFRGRPAK